MSEVQWSAEPLKGVPEWTERQASAAGICGSCDKDTTLRPDPLVGQMVCKPCWEAMMFGQDDE